MSKKHDFERIAKDLGIIRPLISYHRASNAYIISIADVPMTSRDGYTSLEVGLYHSVDEAKEKLRGDIRTCIDRNLTSYPDILDHVTKQYHLVTLELSDKDITYQLLQTLAKDPATTQQAKIALRYIKLLESRTEADTIHPKGTYESQYPDAQKKPIHWEQPDYREHPVYTFELTCPYCGREVTLERHSPRPPAHCGKDECTILHNRALARERKRRQRVRQKADKD